MSGHPSSQYAEYLPCNEYLYAYSSRRCYLLLHVVFYWLKKIGIKFQKLPLNQFSVASRHFLIFNTATKNTGFSKKQFKPHNI